ncbi:MAG: TetR/AcrR family transcriptional regulator [Geobacter sp.]|nr:MAG: TetR/AcrR family transcriptional regulator [Geobacter sp.]
MAEKHKKLSKKEIIMREAEKIFAEKGYYHTTVRDIARASDSNIAMLYYYFSDKENLYLEILDRTFSKIHEIIGISIQKGVTYEEKIRLLISSYIQFLGTKQDTARIIAWEMIEGGKFVPRIVERYFAPNFKNFQDIFKKGMEEDVFNSLDAELTPFSMIGMIVFFFFSAPVIKRILAMKTYDKPFMERLIGHTINLFFNGLMKTGAKESSPINQYMEQRHEK